MRRLVLLVLISLGLVGGVTAPATAKAEALTFSAVTVGPGTLFPDTCATSFVWNPPDSAKVATYYAIGMSSPFTYAQPKNHQPNTQGFEQPTNGFTYESLPSTVLYMGVLVKYTNGTYSPWQYTTVTTGTC